MHGFLCHRCRRLIAEMRPLDDKGNVEMEAGAVRHIVTKNGNRLFVCPHCGHEHVMIEERGEGGILRMRII